MTEHHAVPVVVYVGDIDCNGHPDFESEAVEVQLRCGCTEALQHDFGHELVDPRTIDW